MDNRKFKEKKSKEKKLKEKKSKEKVIKGDDTLPKINPIKRNFDEANYNPRIGSNPNKKTKQNLSNSNIYAARTDTSETFIDEQGQARDLKTAIIFNWDAIEIYNKYLDKEEIIAEVEKRLEKKIAHHRPVGKVIETSDYNQSPTKIETPNKSVLNRHIYNESYMLFSNYNISPQLNPNNPKATLQQLPKTDEFYESKAYSQLKKFVDEAEKKQSLTITKKFQREIQKEIQQNFHKRVISQNRVMSENAKDKEGSANDYAAAIETLNLKNLKWEWLHLVAHEIAGSQSQNMFNLAGGTEYANTEMMAIEAQMKTLTQFYPEGFDLEVTSKFIEATDDNDDTLEHLQIATKIEYRIKTPDFGLLFVFNAQNERQPLFALKTYVSVFVEVMCELAKIAREKLENENRENVNNTNNNFSI